MTAAAYIAALITTGRLEGAGISLGASVADLDMTVPVSHVQDSDPDDAWTRRDYGLLEVSLSGGPRPVLTGATLELHRLATHPSLADEWEQIMGVRLPRYTAWTDIAAVLGGQPLSARLDRVEQGGFTEYRAPDTRVSVLVVNEPGEERDDWPGHGDVWSVALG